MTKMKNYLSNLIKSQKINDFLILNSIFISLMLQFEDYLESIMRRVVDP